MVQGDTDGLIRLFVNLIDNAIKYTEQGGIIVEAAMLGRTAEVMVHDTGIGIAPEHLPHIFDRFYRVDAARTTPGAGLGLSIAQTIVQGHKGEIEVKSVPAQGTTFTVRLLSAR